MATQDGIREIPEMSNDPHVRVFRRTLGALDGFEGIEVDAYILSTEHYLIVCDTLLCPEDVAFLLEQAHEDRAGRSVLCVNSHADWDHAWGNGYFTGANAAPILAHAHCRTRLLSERARTELVEFQQQHPVFRTVSLIPPTLTFTRQLTLIDGSMTIELLHAPGHHLDEIVAWLPEQRLLLAFDALEWPFPGIENAACAPLMFETLARLENLAPERILCSHGGTTSPRILQENFAYLREIKERCQRLLQQRTPEPAELLQSAELIEYPFDTVIAAYNDPLDHTFYSQVHEQNARAILSWLLKSR